MDTLQVHAPADFHTHVRQGEMLKSVAPHISRGGFSLAYIMPNTNPPVTTTDQAVAYRSEIQSLVGPDVQLLMTLFLSPSLTPAEIVKAKKAGVAGVKSYPRGVTTGSDAGVESYERYYPVFEEMQRQGLVLNLHGEIPSNPQDGTTVLNAEPRFLSHLTKIHEAFPSLKIVLEHATTASAIQTVLSLGPSVGCSITAHHLLLIIDDWAGQPLHFCKPVAKTYEDRRALREAVLSGNPKFFLGSDSAPHPFHNKMPALQVDKEEQVTCASCACAAGVYTSPYLLPIVAHAFEAVEPRIPLERLQDFVSNNGRRFYGVPATEPTVTLRRTDGSSRPVKHAFSLKGAAGSDGWIVPFKAGKDVGWEIVQ